MDELTPAVLLAAYAQGIFPMAHPGGQIDWYSPDPRAILPLDSLHISASLMRKIRRANYAIRYDTAFREVISACAAVGPGREITWINDEIIDAYVRLHHLGFAHSVEVWMDDELVGGLYGVGLRGLFAGESMFSRVRDSSKIALYYLVKRLRKCGYTLLDVQFQTPHLERLGAIELPRYQYLRLLRNAMLVDAHFHVPDNSG